MAVKALKAKSPLLQDELDSAVLTHYVVTKNPVYKEKAYEMDMLIKRGVRPEALPPAEDVKKIERRLDSDDKKAAKGSK